MNNNINNLKAPKPQTREDLDAKISELVRGLNDRQTKQVEICPRPYRLRYARALVREIPPATAIRAKCEECVGWEDVHDRVGSCTVTICPLWKFRPYQTESDQEEVLEAEPV